MTAIIGQVRVGLIGAGLIGLAAALSACADAYTPLPFDLTLSPVDPEEAAERAIVGAALGAGLGAGLGTMASINPGMGGPLPFTFGTSDARMVMRCQCGARATV